MPLSQLMRLLTRSGPVASRPALKRPIPPALRTSLVGPARPTSQRLQHLKAKLLLFRRALPSLSSQSKRRVIIYVPSAIAFIAPLAYYFLGNQWRFLGVPVRSWWQLGQWASKKVKEKREEVKEKREEVNEKQEDKLSWAKMKWQDGKLGVSETLKTRRIPSSLGHLKRE